MSFEIKTYSFQKPVTVKSHTQSDLLSDHPMGTNWPVVYLIHGNEEMYVGETNSATGRMEQHLDPKGKFYKKRKKLDTVEIIFDRTFNKSAILDIENALIGLFRYEIKQTKDQKKKSKYFKQLQNGNGGQSKLHNYYNRAYYQDEVEKIWGELINMQLATNQYQDIVNDAIFKFSPYTSLNEEQRETCLTIMNGIMDALERQKKGESVDYTAVVNGVAGTGKTIVLVNLLARITEAMYSNRTNLDTDYDNDDALEHSAVTLDSLSEEARLINRIKSYVKKYGKLRIGYVAQMTSLRNTIATVIKELKHIRKKDSMGPFDVVKNAFGKDPYDILLVDEAHRLWQYKKIGACNKKFANVCSRMYGDGANPADFSTLDWIMDCSRTRVLVYDEFQTVKESDITPQQFQAAMNRGLSKPSPFFLKQQMRCRAGTDYLCYLDNIFKDNPDQKIEEFDHYDLFYYDDPNKLIDDIVTKDVQVGLCKVTTGYGWQWKKPKYDACDKMYKKYLVSSKQPDTRAGKVQFYLNNLNVEDGLIEFGGKRYVRNLDFNWILKGDPREIGCIHTSQGYDLNYVGVLFGPEIDYVEGSGIVINVKKIKDTNSIGNRFKGLTPEQREEKEKELRNYIINSYKVMMTRGIKGCFLYAHNPGLKAYLSKFFKAR